MAIEVTVTAGGYGEFAQVVETLPDGFTFVESNHDAVVDVGQVITFTLLGDDSVTYTVTASETDGDYEFTGILKDDDRQEFAIGGASIVTVLSPATPTPEPTIAPTQAPTLAASAGPNDGTPDSGAPDETGGEEPLEKIEIIPLIIGAFVVLAIILGGGYLFLRRR